MPLKQKLITVASQNFSLSLFLSLGAAVPLLFSFNTLWSSTFSRKKFRTPIRLVWSQGQSACMLMTDKSLSFFMSCLKAQSVFLPKHSPYNVPSVSSFRLIFPLHLARYVKLYTHTKTHICFELMFWTCKVYTAHRAQGQGHINMSSAGEKNDLCY